ncbi:MAG: peptidoglycan DD-metalloendopeptidase family protein [Dehalococcoidia bacterium]
MEIIQGYNGGTHTGVERYSLDLVRSGGGTSGSPVVASAGGTVAFAQVPGAEHGCIGVALEGETDFHYMLCHILLDHAYSYGDRVQAGQLLGTVGAPGLVGNNGTAHVHLQLYTLPGGARTPVPFAPPEGLPLDGVSMPARSGVNQWACSGPSCQNLVSGNGPAPSVTVSPIVLQPSTMPPMPRVTAPLGVGQLAVVRGTGDCLRTHMQPHLDAKPAGCAPDGTVTTIADGPVDADGHTWWYLFNLGWSVLDYLQPTGLTSTSSAPVVPSLPATPATTTTDFPAAATMTTIGSNSPAQGPPVGRSAVIAVGALVRVTGTNDCLVLRSGPSLAASALGCLADGSISSILDGPRSADGYTWWLLDDGGWAAADYLQAVPFQ